MTTSRASLLSFAAVACSIDPSPSSARTEAHCGYRIVSLDVYDEGRCTVVPTKIDGSYVNVVTFDDGRKFRIAMVDMHQQKHTIRINGSPGIGFDISREEFVAVTKDFDTVVEWRNT